MPVESITDSAVNANYVSQLAKGDQAATPAAVNQDAQKVIQATKTDTVTISKQAVQMLASDGDTLAVEAKETAAEKATEKLRGKK